MGWLEDFLHKLKNNIGQTIRKFTAFGLFLFFLGAVYGAYVDKIATLVSMDHNILLFVPLALAVLAYLFTEIAFVLFIFLLILLLIVFL